MTDRSPRTPGSNRSAFERVSLIGTVAVADFHQGTQSKHCNFDAVYMAATEITPSINRKALAPREPSIHGSSPMAEVMGLQGTLRANKSETFDSLKFTLWGAGERSDGNARTPAHALFYRA